MIKLLAESDRDTALDFLDRDHELNIIMINDIERFGLDDGGRPFQGQYYAASRGGDLGGIAVIYNFGSMFIYAPDSELAPELIEHMASLDKAPHFLSGRIEWSDALLNRLVERGIRVAGSEEQEFMTLSRGSFKPRQGPTARFAEPGDLDGLINLNRGFQVEYFGTQLEALEELGKMAEARMADSGIAVVEQDGELVAKAEVMASTDKAALIGGVYTEPEHRGRGFSLACMSLLSQAILESGRKPCLNVSKENQPALHVYRSLGFKKLCDYRMAHFG